VRNPQPGGDPRGLVLQHHPDEHPGSLGPLLEGRGITLTTVELDGGVPIPALEPFGLLVVMGGPQQVWEDRRHPWLAEEKEVIRHWVTELRRPFLGVCLGHQLLVDAIGGRVRRMEKPEIGVLDIRRTAAGASDPLFGALPSTFPGLQWHEAEVVDPPPGATVLASSRVSPVQAIRVGPRALGVQFHVEVGADTVSKWSAVPEYERTLAAHFGTADTLERAVAAELGPMTSVAMRLVGALLDDVCAIQVTPV
jgi:GMP synthase-like glutamine amidotransferase